VQPDIHSTARSGGRTIQAAIFEEMPGNVIRVWCSADMHVFA
jgi:hypothetical protein